MKKDLFRKELSRCATLVVKVGSKIVAMPDSAEGRQRMQRLVADLCDIAKEGLRVVLVSSGAIAHGMAALRLQKRPATMPLKQACASIGQHRLMLAYASEFDTHDVPIGQVLLTWDDLRDKKRYLNLRNTLFQLLECGAIPIINENDSVGIEEIRFGDNDTLGAQIAMLINADLYVMITDVNGLYDKNPLTHKDARHIPLVTRITGLLHDAAAGNSSEISVGGMRTKIKAAEIVTRAGIPALIGNGCHGRLSEILRDPDAATLFTHSDKRMNARDRWIAFAGKPKGILIIDKGAVSALLEKGKSLLPAGVKRVSGTFSAGDTVEIQTEEYRAIARGMANYSCEEIDKLRGCKTSEIELRLGQKTFDEVVHRDNMALL
jgi:glutamate 5-kinase